VQLVLGNQPRQGLARHFNELHCLFSH
jgi:hypothetical protein